MAACRQLWLMMSRLKARPLKPLLNKRLSKGEDESHVTVAVSLASMCTAVSVAVLVVVPQVGLYWPLCLSLAMVIAVFSGLCLSEILSSHAMGCQSIYSCLYQSVCEIVAFFVGWTWFLSLTAILAAILKLLSNLIDEACDNKISRYLQYNVPSYATDVFLVLVMAVVLIMCLTGISFMKFWPAVSMPLTFLMITAVVIVKMVVSNKAKWMTLDHIQVEFDEEKLMNGAVLCLLGFMGPQTALRLTNMQIHWSSGRLFGIWNIVCYIVSLFGGYMIIVINFYSKDKDLLPIAHGAQIFAFLFIPSLCLLALEQFHPVLTVVQDMSNDGLLCRSLSKSWKSMCQRVPTVLTFLLVVILSFVLLEVSSLLDVLKIGSTATLVINIIVAITLLVLRYQDRDAWQYEPMLQNGGASHHYSRKKSTEFLPRTDLSSPNLKTNKMDSDSEDSSETDIDSVVQEYKEKVQMASFNSLDMPSQQGMVQEPTASSSFKAKFIILGLVAISFLLAVSITVAIRTRAMRNTTVLSVMAMAVLLSTLCTALLQRLPRNKSLSNTHSSKSVVTAPLVPWIPSFTILLSMCLLVHIIPDIWQVLLSWTVLGLFLYLGHGMRNSTAASSFYQVSIPTQVCNFQPFPLQKEVCLRHVIQPEKKNRHRTAQTA